MLFLSFVKKKYEMPPDSIESNKNRLFWFLADHPTDWGGFMSLRLWILVVLAVATPVGDREMHVSEIVVTMEDMELLPWTEAVSVVKGIAWIEEVSKGSLHELGKDVSMLQLNSTSSSKWEFEAANF
jgi:hypothetical protein